MTEVSREVRARSFGAAAEQYDRARPRAVAAAVDWLVPPHAQDVLDLAAGTGLFTRRLLGRVPNVIAVEPDAQMRAVLARRSPAVDVREGTGEHIPLPDASVDAVFVSSAWHWMDPDLAVREVARVLRPGGRFGLIWTSRDGSVDWVAELGQIIGRDNVPTRPPRTLEVAAGAPFTTPETASFTAETATTSTDVIEQLMTYSGMLTASAVERDVATERARELLARLFPTGAVTLPLRSFCIRTDRR